MENSRTPEKNRPSDTREATLTVRLRFDTFDTIKRAAQERGTTMSDMVREHLEYVCRG